MKRLKVAIIGGGPGGLGAAIELSRLPFVDWALYEKRSKISEIGGGFTLQPQTWRLLELNGVARDIGPDDFFRAPDACVEQRRNGRNGKWLLSKMNAADVPPCHHSCRIGRPRLQKALLKHVNQTRVHLSKRFVRLEQMPNDQTRIFFSDGDVEDVDLLIAADGIRSCIRSFCFPEHTLYYNGQSVYRTIISKKEALKIKGLPLAPVFWKHTSGLYVHTCPLGDDDFEVTARILRPATGEEPVSWGRPFDLHKILHEYDDFCQPVRSVLRLASEGDTQEFALFSGPPLHSVTSSGNIAFIGDASHAMLGNFGCGVAFALEDVYTLARALDWAWSKCLSMADALDLFDSIRSPHYDRLHTTIAKFADIKAKLKAENLPLDQEIEERVNRIHRASEDWMYFYKIDEVVDKAIETVERRDAHGQLI